MILSDREKFALRELVSNIRAQQDGHNEQDAILNAPKSLLDKLVEAANQ